MKNKTFYILEVFAILFVVLSHGSGISLLCEIFPFGSFMIQLFIFISGYFYSTSKENDTWNFIKSRIKKFLIPYFLWNLFYGIVVVILSSLKLFNAGISFNLYNLFVEPFISGHQFIFNLASWFIIVIFFVQIIYFLLRKFMQILKIKTSVKDIALFGIFFCLSLVLVYLSNNNKLPANLICFEKVGFLLLFYHIGYLYKQYFEKKDNLSNLAYFAIIFVIQFIIFYFESNIDYLVVHMNFHNNMPISTIIASLTGILFWLRISKILSKSIGDSKIIEYIGKNTYTIMMHHLFIFYLINLSFVVINHFHTLPGFNAVLAKSDIWYKYYCLNGKSTIIYAILGIAIPLICKKIWDKFLQDKYIHIKEKISFKKASK